MNGPRRLTQSAGPSKQLLDSASIDKPSEGARRRALLAATASSFAATQSGRPRSSAVRSRASTAKTLVTWALIGAAASGTLVLLASRVLNSANAPNAASQPTLGTTVMAEPAMPPPHIASEPPSPPPLSPEAMAQQIEALRTSGKTTEARALANQFLAKYPQHPLAERVRGSLAK